MASVWGCSNQYKKPRKIVGYISPEDAQIALGKAAAEYAAFFSKKLGAALTHKTVSQIEVHVMRGKDVIAHFWIELLSPPSLPQGGDIYRMKGAK